MHDGLLTAVLQYLDHRFSDLIQNKEFTFTILVSFHLQLQQQRRAFHWGKED